jgi:tRNA(Ile)-lysidine synthase TilS/MesJ
MFQYTEKRCSKCLLQEDTARNFLINDDGLCSFCANMTEEEKDYARLEGVFRNKIEQIKAQKSKYDAILMMSGGKDSAYLAWLLKEKYGLTMLALTIDNNFEYEETFERASELCKTLDIAHMQFRIPPSLTRTFYRFIMSEQPLKEKDFGQLCLYCGKYLLDHGIVMAEQFGIPAVIVGYNPDQLFGMGRSIEVETQTFRIRQQQAIARKIEFQFKKAEAHAAQNKLHELIPVFKLEHPRCQLIYPFLYLKYEPLKMMDTVRRELGWRPIESFSKGTYIASGCKLLKLMAALAKINNVSSYMDLEFSNQVRTGALTKEALEKYYASLEEDESFYTELLSQLGIAEPLQSLAAISPAGAAGNKG